MGKNKRTGIFAVKEQTAYALQGLRDGAFFGG
jgi:hypothetical protein